MGGISKENAITYIKQHIRGFDFDYNDCVKNTKEKLTLLLNTLDTDEQYKTVTPECREALNRSYFSGLTQHKTIEQIVDQVYAQQQPTSTQTPPSSSQ